MAVHPRVCGEQLQFGLIPRLLGGSSPRVRGTGPARRIPVPVTRFIPACAGNRTLMPWPYWRRTVHPRVCGEQVLQSSPTSDYFGSSPRVRGTASGHMMWTLENRFIPACAGNRSFLEKAFPLQPVHPRVCGEQVCRFNSDVIQDGSSPRVRGTVSLVPLARMMDRFIPACAGNSHNWRHSSWWRAVHPRVCGEQTLKRHHLVAVFGSSPRVRGTDRVPCPVQLRLRFIPACAGNSPQ